MSTQQTSNVTAGLIFSAKASITATLSGFALSQAIAAYRLIIQTGGFFLVPYSFILNFSAHILTFEILSQLTYEIGKIAYGHFRETHGFCAIQDKNLTQVNLNPTD